MTARFPLQNVMCCGQHVWVNSFKQFWISLYLTIRLLTCLIGRYSFKPLLASLSACRHSCLPYCASCLIVLSLPSPTRHGSLFVPFRGMPFDTFGLQRACGWRMNEYQGNLVLVCVGCGVGGHSLLGRLLYCFFNLDIREWNKNKMSILAENCCWVNMK